MGTWTDDLSLQKTLVDQMMYVSMHYSRKILHADQLVETFGMPMSEIQLLFAVSDGEYTIGELADFLGIHKPNVAPTVNSLVKKGYIERVASDTDGRKIYVRLLHQGEICIAKIRNHICEQLIQHQGIHGSMDAKNLNKAMGTIVRTMRNQT